MGSRWWGAGSEGWEDPEHQTTHPQPETTCYIVEPTSARERLDLFLAKAIGFSRSRIRRLIERGLVLVNGRPSKGSHRVLPGERILLTIPPPEPSDLQPEPIPLSILDEDEDILVLDKPAGLVVHPAAGHERGTLVNALLHYDPTFATLGERGRPGIVHRLDKGTSGVMVVAKTETAKASLERQFNSRQVKKIYLALVHGKVKEGGRIEAPIGRREADRKRMGIRTRKGREAVTAYQVIESFNGFTLLAVHPETGRTHQIRVHLSAIGHPVVGDKVYGGKRERKGVRGQGLGVRVKAERQLLHAWKLGFFHPRTGEWVEFEAPIPDDFKSFIATLSKGPHLCSTSLERVSFPMIGRRANEARGGVTMKKGIGWMGLVGLLLVGAIALRGGEAYAVGGVLLWEDQVDKAGGPDVASAVAVDRGRVFAAGFGENAAGNLDFLVRAYDAE